MKTKQNLSTMRDPVKTLCERYEATLKARAILRGRHADVFEFADRLASEIEEMESEIKTAIRPRYAGHQRGTFVEYEGPSVTISATVKHSTHVDADAMLAETPELRQYAGLIVTTFNPEMLSILVSGGYVSRDAVDRHTTIEQATTAIKIAAAKTTTRAAVKLETQRTAVSRGVTRIR